MTMKNKKIKTALFAVMLLSLISAVFFMKSQKIGVAQNVSSPSEVVITRTSGLDLTSNEVTYVSKGGIVKRVNPQTSNITDTAEGWAWYKTETMINDVVYQAQSLVLSGIDFQIDKPFTTEYYYNPGYDVTGCALRMPITSLAKGGHILLEDGTVNTIIALEPINTPNGVKKRETFDFYTVFLTCQINGNGVLKTENLDWFVGPPASGYHFIEFGTDGTHPNINILHGRLYNPNGNITVNGGTFNIINDIVVGNWKNSYGIPYTQEEIDNIDLVAVSMYDGTIYIKGNNTNFYAKGKDYGFSYGYRGSVNISGNGTVVFEGNKQALIKAPSNAPVPTEGNWNEQRVVYGSSQNKSVTLTDMGKGAYGFGYYFDTTTVEIYAGKRDGYIFDYWTAIGVENFDDVLKDKTNFTLSGENVILTAVWKKASYKINYQLNGGSFSSPATKEYTFGTELTLAVPSWGSYTFDGWYSNPMLTGTAITEITADEFGDMILYAKWNGVAYYTITASMGANGIINPSGSIIYDGTNQKYEVVPYAGYKVSSFTVDGVEKAEELVNNVYMVSGITANSAIYVSFEEITSTDITVLATATQGGSISPAGYSIVENGGSITYLISANPDYYLSRLYIDGTAVQIVDNMYSMTDITSSKTIHAVFELSDAQNQTAVFLNKNGGQDDSSVTVSYGSLIPAFETIKRENYTLIGYFTAASDGDEIITAEGFLVPSVSGYSDENGKWICLDENITFYARWELNAPSISAIQGYNGIYDGETHAISITVENVSDGIVVCYQWYKGSVSNENKTGTDSNRYDLKNVVDSGDYFCEIYATDGNLISVASISGRISVSIGKRVVAFVWNTTNSPDGEIYSGAYTYDGKEHGVYPFITNICSNEEIGLSVANNVKINASDLSYTTETVVLIGANDIISNYTLPTEDLNKEFSIMPKNISGAAITLGAHLTYNSAEQIQTVISVEIDGMAVTFDVTGNTGVGAGNYTLKINANGNFSGTADKLWEIAKADYDISGLTFADITVKEDGNTHSVAVSGELPSGVLVSYQGNDKKIAGVYTVTAIFSGDSDNYNTIPDMTSILKILIAKFSENTNENPDGKFDIIITSERGFEPDITFETSAVLREESGQMRKVYTISFYRSGEIIKVNENITVKLLIPVGVDNKKIRLYSGEEEIAYIAKDGYAVFTADTLSEVLLIYEYPKNDRNSYSWLIIISAILLLAGIGFATYKILKKKNRKKTV